MKADPTTTCRPAAGSGWVDQRVPEQCWTPANRPVKPNLRPGASLAGRRRSNADADERAGSVAGSRAGDPDRRSSYAPYGTRKRFLPPSPLSVSEPLPSSRAISVAPAARPREAPPPPPPCGGEPAAPVLERDQRGPRREPRRGERERRRLRREERRADAAVGPSERQVYEPVGA